MITIHRISGPLSFPEIKDFLENGIAHEQAKSKPFISPATRNELINALTIADLSEFKPVKVA